MIKQNNTLVIILAFNEEKSIGGVIDNLCNSFKNTDILVVNDGSIDHTLEIIKNKPVFIVDHPFNMGIGSSFQTGCLFARAYGYDYIIRIDADGQHSVDFVERLLEPVKNKTADIAVGSRFLGNSEFKTSFFRLIGIFILAKTLSFITGKKITDPTSGFCAMNRRAFEFFSKNCAEDYPEPEILIHHSSFKITEVAVTMLRRTSGVSSITAWGSIYYMFKVLLSLLVNSLGKKEKR